MNFKQSVSSTACLFECVFVSAGACVDMCSVCVHLLCVCLFFFFFCPSVSPKQGKRIIITSSECISPSFSLEQNNTHHTHLLPASSPQRYEKRPGVKCKRENAVVQTVPTTSVSLSLSPSLMLLVSSSDSSSCLFLTLCLCHHFSHSSLPPSFPLRWAGCCRLQVCGTPQPMKNECRRAP